MLPACASPPLLSPLWDFFSLLVGLGNCPLYFGYWWFFLWSLLAFWDFIKRTTTRGPSISSREGLYTAAAAWCRNKGSLISITVKQCPVQALTFMKKKNVAVANALNGLDAPQHSAAVLTCQKLLTIFCSAAQIVALSGGFPFISHGFLKSSPQVELDPTCFKPKRAFHNNPFSALSYLLCI